MNENAKCYYDSALKLLMPVALEPDLEGFVLTLGKKNYFFYDFGTPVNNAMAPRISRNKFFTNVILKKAGLPVPKGVYIHVSEFEEGRLEEIIKDLSFPLVAKPLIDGRFGWGVLCNIQNIEQLTQYMHQHIHDHQYILIEKFHAQLNSYRVLIFNNQILGVIQRYPAHVIGDGEHTIEELVDITNKQRAQGSDTLKPILIDEECHICLTEQGLDVLYKPLRGERINLCYTCNAYRGGTYVTLDKNIGKKNSQLLIKAAQALNLKLVGFDVLSMNIYEPLESSGGVIIESNDSPSIRIHEQALVGQANLVTRKIMRSFIYRHPLSYLWGLYRHERTKIYFRSIIFMMVASIFYALLL